MKQWALILKKVENHSFKVFVCENALSNCQRIPQLMVISHSNFLKMISWFLLVPWRGSA